MNDLQSLKNLIEEMNTTNSLNEKKVILAKYPECKELLRYTYDTINLVYGVTSKSLKKNIIVNHSDMLEVDTIQELLNNLNDRTITGYAAVASVNYFVKLHREFEDVIHCIIDRNLKIRVDTSVINKVFPDCVPVFNVSKADKYKKYYKKISFTKDTWFVSRKLDGVRCVAIIESPDNIVMKSLLGNSFTTLQVIIDSLKEIAQKNNLYNVVVDGELCLIDENGNESFQGIMKLIRKKDFTIPNPKYKVFDFLTLQEFESQKGNSLFSHRLKDLNLIMKTDYVEAVKQSILSNNTDLQDHIALANENGWEGLILRKDAPYKGKRSSDILKVKKFYDAEYVVKETINGPIQHIENGLSVVSDMLSSIIIEHKGFDVGVGSGFSMEQRQHFYNHPDDIVGKTITVSYFEETENKNGEISLRFATLKYIYEEGRNV